MSSLWESMQCLILWCKYEPTVWCHGVTQIWKIYEKTIHDWSLLFTLFFSLQITRRLLRKSLLYPFLYLSATFFSRWIYQICTKKIFQWCCDASPFFTCCAIAQFFFVVRTLLLLPLHIFATEWNQPIILCINIINVMTDPGEQTTPHNYAHK